MSFPVVTSIRNYFTFRTGGERFVFQLWSLLQNLLKTDGVTIQNVITEQNGMSSTDLGGFLYQAIRAQILSLSRYLTSLVFRNKLQNRISNGRFWEYCVIASFQAPLNFFFLLFNLYLTIYPAGHLVNFSNLNSQMDTQFQNTFQRKCPKKTLKLAERCSRKNQPRSREEDEPSGKRTMILSTYLRTVRKLRVSWQIIICEISKRRRDSNAELEKGNF